MSLLPPVRRAAAVLFCAATVCGAAQHEQVIDLSPGWNAVYLEVTPKDGDPASVFEGLPLEMVWAYFPSTGPTEFIADPEEGLWNVPGWHVYLPDHREDAALTNLHAVIAPRAYLIKLGGETPATWTVTGKLAHRAPDWIPGGNTLAGLPVDPERTVNFGSFFHPSDAHRNQPYHRLTPEGTWVRAHNSTPISRGEAYWIHSTSASAFHGPLGVTAETGRSLDYGENTADREVRLRNHSQWPTTASLAVTNDLPLLLAQPGESGRTEWEPLNGHEIALDPGEERALRVGLDRSGLAGPVSGVLTVTGADTRHDLPVEAFEPGGASLQGDGFSPAGDTRHTGLWIGTVTVNAVGDANAQDPTDPQPTPADFSKRVIIHVDAGGAAHLLKEAILLWQDGETAEDTGETLAPGQYVLISDHDLIPHYKGSVLRDGRPFGHRVSAATFDYEGTDLLMRGAFGDALLADIAVARDLPTNPFRHTFHPDHNHLDNEQQPRGDTSVGREEVWPVYREIELVFEDDASTASVSGRRAARGIYRETLSNLHREPIHLRGTFELRRANPIAELNPQP
ncbi:MAG: hypothetical protein JJU00_11690 [Opitutales bacterium]|nr:hypothetical protein [Opitutales bacterium]